MSAQFAAVAAIAGIGAYVLYSRQSKTDKSHKPIFSSFGIRKLRLHGTEMINHNTKKLRFELPDPNQPSGLSLTSALLSISFPNGSWRPVLRPYTPTNDLSEPGFIELMVKLYPNGKGSGYLHSLKPGDTLSFLPIPGLAWKPNLHPHVVGIAGGAGITPMYQLARGILKNPDDRTRITIVWGVNTEADMFLKDEFSELEKKYGTDRFKVVYVVASPASSSAPYEKGFVTAEMLEKHGLSSKEEKNRDARVLVCGPPPMEKALKAKEWGVLAKLGYKPDQIHTF